MSNIIRLSNPSDSLISNLKLFGFTESEAIIYLKLIENGKTTALQLSKKLKIPRTKVYRILDKLLNKGFVNQETKGYGTNYVAESYEKLNLLINEKENSVNEMRASTSLLFNQLAQLKLQSTGESKILHYRGMEGLKHVIWNSTKVEGDFRIYEVNKNINILEKECSNQLRKDFAKHQNNRFYQLTNKTEFKELSISQDINQKWQVRHISKDDLDIRFEIQIYGDVYCMFEYTTDDVFIVEIHNKNLAQMQKQLFDFTWKHSTPIRILNSKGVAKVEKF